jgi:HK97 family phage major capsid protein
MDLKKEEKDALFAEFKSAIAKDNKADIEKINTLITEKMALIDDSGKVNAELKKRCDELETKMGRPLKDGMTEDKTDEFDGLKFQDKDGNVYEAKSLKNKLFTGPEEFSVGKILRAKILGDNKGLNDFETKAIGEGIGAGGGWLLNEQISASLIDLARAKSCVNLAGAVTLQMPTPEMRLVKLTGDPTAYWVAEHGEITESEWSLAPINLKAMTIGVLVRSSLELLEDAQNAGSQIEASMSAAIALAVDQVALLGDGVNHPRGLDLCSGVNTISKGVNGGTITNYDDFSNAVEDVYDNNGIPTAIIYAPRTHFTIDRLKEGTTNAPLPPPKSFEDLKKFVTNQIGIVDTQGTCTAASKAFIGDFKQLLYGIRKNIEMEVTRQGGTKTFAKCEALIRARMRLDVAVLRENHFTKIYGIKV